LGIVLADNDVKVVLVNIFGGGILRCDDVANAIILSLDKTKVKKPMIVRLAGANSESGLQKLSSSRYRITQAEDMLESAKVAVERANKIQPGSASGSEKSSGKKWWRKLPLVTSAD